MKGLLFAHLLGSAILASAGEQSSSVPLVGNVDVAGQEVDWSLAAPTDLAFEVSPRWGAKIESTASYRVLASEEALHVLVEVRQGEGINATAVKHDTTRPQDDGVTLYIAPEAFRPRAFKFSINAAGATADSITASGPGANPDWTGDWSGIATITSDGYEVAFLVPWSTLGVGIDASSIGLYVERQVGNGRYQREGSAALNRSLSCFECQFPSVSVPAIRQVEKSSLDVRWLPYLMVGDERTYDVTTSESLSRARELEAGLDVSATTAGGLNILATLNPDFSQVQDDSFVSTINKRFASTFAERRPFFTENAGYFSTPLGLLYTRNIQDPGIGVQAVSSHSGGTRALMAVNDSVTSLYSTGPDGSYVVTIPSSSWNAIYRDTRSVGQDGASTWGTFFAGRSAGGYSNLVAAADLSLIVNDENHITAQIAASSVKNSSREYDLSSSSRGLAAMLRYVFSRGGYQGSTDITTLDDDFRADLSANLRTGTSSLLHASSYTWAWSEKSKLSSLVVDLAGGAIWRSGGALLEDSGTLSGELTFSNEISMSGSTGTYHYVDGDKTVGGSMSDASLRFPISNNLRGAITVTHGSQPDFVNASDGELFGYSLSLSVIGLDWLDGSLIWVNEEFDSDVPGAEYRTANASAKVNLHFNLKNHLSLFISTADYDDRLMVGSPALEPDVSARWQVVYTWEPARFTKFIIGGSQTYRGGELIPGIQRQRELVFAKLIYEI